MCQVASTTLYPAFHWAIIFGNKLRRTICRSASGDDGLARRRRDAARRLAPLPCRNSVKARNLMRGSRLCHSFRRKSVSSLLPSLTQMISQVSPVSWNILWVARKAGRSHCFHYTSALRPSKYRRGGKCHGNFYSPYQRLICHAISRPNEKNIKHNARPQSNRRVKRFSSNTERSLRMPEILIFQKGGAVMYGLAALSVYAVAVVILKRSSSVKPTFSTAVLSIPRCVKSSRVTA